MMFIAIFFAQFSAVFFLVMNSKLLRDDKWKLAMANSIVLATAQAYDAVFWTQDSDFKNLEGIRFRAKK